MADRKLQNIELGRIGASEYSTLAEGGTVLVLDNIRSAHNVGSALRTAAAFRAALECCCIGIDPNVYALCITGSKRTLLHKAARITGFDAKKFDFISDCGADLSTMDEFDIDAIEYPPAKELPFKPLKEGWPLKDIETDCAKRLLALSAGYADIDGFMAEEYNGEAVTA